MIIQRWDKGLIQRGERKKYVKNNAKQTLTRQNKNMQLLDIIFKSTVLINSKRCFLCFLNVVHISHLLLERFGKILNLSASWKQNIQMRICTNSERICKF